jgi:beta-lactamase regulating signal transducer with metallopeptidase domain
MESLLMIGLENAVAAALLAGCVALITRFWKNPHIAHVLWLIVLLRLVAPPVVQIPFAAPNWLAQQRLTDSPKTPAVDPLASNNQAASHYVPTSWVATTPAPASPRVPTASPGGATEKPAVSRTPSDPVTVNLLEPEQPILKPIHAADFLISIWIAGTALYAAITGLRVRRFATAVRHSHCPAPNWLHDEVSAVATSLRLRRVPRLAVVEGTLPPMVWSGWRPTLLVPRTIVESFDPSQRRLLLLHELLHIRRRDHVIRWFAVAVLALNWWNPIAWWAVRRMQNAEEECCDAGVLFFYPQQSEIYGEALLAVSEFVSCGSLPAAAVSIGVERKNHLKRRMTMILKGSRWPRLSWTQLTAVIGCGAVIVGISLTTAAAQVEPVSEAKSEPKAEPGKAGAPRPAPIAKEAAPQKSKSNLAQPPASAPGEPPKLPAYLRNEPLQRSPGDDETQKILKERYNAAIRAVALFHTQYDMNTLPLGNVLSSARRAMEAKLALAKTQREQSRAVADYHDMALYCWREVHARLEAGAAGSSVPADEAQAREAIFDARLKMEQLFPQGNVKQPDAILKSPKTITTPASAATPQQEGVAVYGWKAVVITPDDDERQKLLKQRYNAAVGTLRLYRAQQEVGGMASLGDLLAAAKRVRVADLAINDKPPGDLEALERYLAFTKYLEEMAESKLAVGSAVGNLPVENSDMREARLAAEIEWSARRSAIAAAAKADQARFFKPRPLANAESQASKADSTTPDGSQRAKSAPIVAIAEKPLPAMLTAKPLQRATGDDELHKLLKDRYNSALKALQGQYERTRLDPQASITTVIVAARTLLDAELAMAAPKETVGIYQRYLEFMSYFDTIAEGMRNNGNASFADFNAVREARLDAEIRLLQATRARQVDRQRGPAKSQSFDVSMRIAEAEVNAVRAVVDQSKAELVRAQVNLKFRQLQLDRLQSLQKHNAVGVETVDEATHARDEAAASVDAARASIQAAQAQVDIKLALLEQVKLDLSREKALEDK